MGRIKRKADRPSAFSFQESRSLKGDWRLFLPFPFLFAFFLPVGLTEPKRKTKNEKRKNSTQQAINVEIHALRSQETLDLGYIWTQIKAKVDF